MIPIIKENSIKRQLENKIASDFDKGFKLIMDAIYEAYLLKVPDSEIIWELKTNLSKLPSTVYQKLIRELNKK